MGLPLPSHKAELRWRSPRRAEDAGVLRWVPESGVRSQLRRRWSAAPCGPS